MLKADKLFFIMIMSSSRSEMEREVAEGSYLAVDQSLSCNLTTMYATPL